MPSNASLRSVRLPTLLAGSAMLALLLTARGANAQNNGAAANGAQALANEQSLRTGIIVADASTADIRSAVTGDIDNGDLAVTDDKIIVTGKGNAAKLSLAPESSGPSAYRVTGLTAGAHGATANGASVIANHQSLGGASVNADIVGAHVSITAGGTSASKLTLLGNAQDAAATGNDAAATLDAQEGGAGLASSQSIDARSSVAARARGGFAVTTGALSGSQVGTSDNLDRAVATGNSAVSNLSLTAPLLSLDERVDPAAFVDTMNGGDGVVNGAAGANVSQSASGIVKAVTFEDNGDPAFATTIGGDATSSSITSDRNALSTTARGNLAATSIDIGAAAIAPSGGQTLQPAPVAAGQTVQSASALDLSAVTIGGTRVTIEGGLTNSTVSASSNSARTAATANQSESGLSLTAATIDAGSGTGVATVDGAGQATADAGAVLQTVQDYGASVVRASHTDAKVGVTVSGLANGSRIVAENNSDLVAATGNDASSLVTADASTLGTSLAVNTLQSGNGDVRANSGTVAEAGGVRIDVEGDAGNSAFTVHGNTTRASAIANLGSNGIGVAAGSVGGASVPATSGPVGNAFGATAAIALASNQKLGEPTNGGTLIPTIESQVFTQSGIAADGTPGSRFAVEDNAQQATAIGNTVGNRLSVEAIDLGDGATGATISLASSQYGQAAVSATSDAQMLVSGQAGTTRLSGNTNIALAAINDADNELSIDTVTAMGTGISDVASDRLGAPVAKGDHVLSSQQFATGSAGAFVTTTIGGSGPATGSDGSTYQVWRNQTTGEASANRVVNAVSVQALDGLTSSGLANTQVNAAETQVSAIGPSSIPLGSPATASDVAIDGNAVSALARGNAAENSIALTTGQALPGTVGRARTDRFGAEAMGGAALLNAQTNFAPVTASAADASFLVPLNAGTVNGSRFSAGGNSISATGYGNTASNSILVYGPSVPTSVIANNQVNNGNVNAFVTGARLDGMAASLSTSSFSMSGNQLSAVAVGNQVSSAITGLR